MSHRSGLRRDAPLPSPELAPKTSGARDRLAGSAKRWVTAVVGVPLSLLAIFQLPSVGFFVICAVVFGLAAHEYVGIARAWAPGAPLRLIPILAVLFAGAWCWWSGADGPLLYGTVLALSGGVGTLILFSRTPIAEAPAALGSLAFGVPYFALAIASHVQLQKQDPWLVFLLIAIVWLGDTAAFYVGSAWGKRRLAPAVSPKKTWEGAIAGFLVGVAATAVWSQLRRGGIEPVWLAIGALTAVAAQVGDLVESVLKRSAGVKDSGSLLPGHGGFLDRSDALLLAGPVLWLALALSETLSPTP